MFLNFNILMTADSIRENIRNLLIKKKISIAKAEKLAGIGSTVLRSFLVGKTQYTNLENLMMLARVLRVDPSELIGYADKTVEEKQHLPWKTGVFSNICNIFDDFLSSQNYALKNFEVFPVLLDVYYLYASTDTSKELDEGMIKLFFLKAFEKNKIKENNLK